MQKETLARRPRRRSPDTRSSGESSDGRAVPRPRDPLGTFLDDILRSVAARLGVARVKILERTERGLLLRRAIGYPIDLPGRALVDDGLRSHAGYALLLADGPVVCEDLFDDPRFSPSPLAKTLGLKSGIAVPIPGPEGPCGVLAAHSSETRAYAPEEVALVRDLAELVARALSLAHREARATRSEGRYRLLAHATAALSSCDTYAETLQTAAMVPVPDLADWCFVDIAAGESSPGGAPTIHRAAVACADPERPAAPSLANELKHHYPIDLTAPHGTPRVLRTAGQPELIQRVTDDHLRSVARDRTHLEAMRRLDMASCMAVPLRHRRRVTGALILARTSPGEPYTQEDLDLACWLADAASNALSATSPRNHQPEGRLEARATAPSARAPDPIKLSPAQKRMLDLLARGLTNDQIADELCVSTVHVRGTLHKINRKLGVQNRAACIVQARYLGLID